MAANRIKGITIELNGETVKLSKALQGLNTSIRQTTAGLRDVDKLLKMDPGNTDLLKQKQQLLATAIEDTKKKLEQEKEALKQLQESGDSDATKAQQDALQREIAETEQKLKSLETEAKNFGAVWAQQMSNAGEKVKDVGDKVTKAGEGLTKNVTAPIVGVGAASIKAFSEVDDGLDIVTKKTGQSGEALKEMQESAKNLATSIPTDFETAGAAIGEVNTRFDLTGQELEDLSGQFIKFAQLNDTDVSTSIDQVQKAMAAFGVDTKDAGGFLDLLTVQAQNTGVDMNTLLTSMTSNAAALSEMGMQADGAAIFLAQLEESGVDASSVLTGMKKALANAAKEGKPMSEAMSDLQKSIAGAKTDEEGMQKAMELFGTKAGPTMWKALKEGQVSFRTLASDSYDFTESMGAVDQTFEGTLDPIDGFKTMMNQLKITLADLAGPIQTLLEPAFEKLKTVVTTLSEKFQALSPQQQEMIVKIAGIIAAIGPLLVIGGKIISLVGSIMTLAPMLAGAISAISLPVLGIIAGIAALIAIGVLLYKHWDEIKAKAAELKDWLSEKFEAIKEAISTKITATKDKISETFEKIRSTIKDKIASAKKTVLQLFEDIKNGIKSKIERAKEIVKSAVDKIKQIFTFEWKLPDLKLPHIVVGDYIDVPVLGTIPNPSTLSVEWYKKAYDSIVGFSKPTVLATAGGYKGFGDGHGREFVMGENKLREIAGDTINVTINVTSQPGQNVNELANIIEAKLTQNVRRQQRVFNS